MTTSRASTHCRPAVVRQGDSGARRLSAEPRFSGVWFCALLFLLGFVIPGAIIAGRQDAPSALFWFTFPLVIASALRFSVLSAGARPRPTELIFWLFSYLFLGLAPLAQLRYGVDPSTTPGQDPSYQTTAIAMAVVGCLAAAAGASLAGPIPEPASPSAATARSHRDAAARSPGVAFRGTVLTSVIGLGASVYFIASVGLSALFTSRQSLFTSSLENLGGSIQRSVIGTVASMSLLAATTGWLILARAEPEKRWTYRIFAAVLACVLLIEVNPINSPRITFGTVLLTLVAILGVYETARRWRLFSASVLALMIVVFPLADLFRRTIGPTSASSGGVVDNLTSGDFDGFAQMANTAWFVTQQDYSFGRQALGVLLFWVPRELWSDKPLDTGVLLAEARGYQFSNLSAPLWAELFINGGWVVLVAGMTILGFFIKRLDQNFNRDLRQGVPRVLNYMLPFYLIMILRGSLLQATSTLIVIVIASWACSMRLGESRPPRSPAGESGTAAIGGSRTAKDAGSIITMGE